VERIGPQHQAGSDSLLTSATFFKMKQSFFENRIDNSKYLGVLYGLGTPYQSSSFPSSEFVTRANCVAEPSRFFFVWTVQIYHTPNKFEIFCIKNLSFYEILRVVSPHMS